LGGSALPTFSVVLDWALEDGGGPLDPGTIDFVGIEEDE